MRIGKPKKHRHIKGSPFIRNLGLLFIGLRLAHQINWSWWLVLSPIIFDGVMMWLVSSWLRKRQEEKFGGTL